MSPTYYQKRRRFHQKTRCSWQQGIAANKEAGKDLKPELLSHVGNARSPPLSLPLYDSFSLSLFITRTTTHRNTLTPSKTLRYTALHCNTLKPYLLEYVDIARSIYLPTHCTTLQHTETQCNTLQHNATHYNTLQHTATHCNTLHHTTLVDNGRSLLDDAH